jgi:hypothetical protein
MCSSSLAGENLTPYLCCKPLRMGPTKFCKFCLSEQKSHPLDSSWPSLLPQLEWRTEQGGMGSADEDAEPEVLQLPWRPLRWPWARHSAAVGCCVASHLLLVCFCLQWSSILVRFTSKFAKVVLPKTTCEPTLLFLLYSWVNWGSEKLGLLPQFTHLRFATCMA